ncbi:sensor domain-containing diguanylate cyclase [Aliidiomarina haloalkalitolerans]|nr:diguanylate cyclase [Aliidiomarina haloalkalitolerans]
MRAKLFVFLACLVLMPLILHAETSDRTVASERELQLPEQPQVSYVVDESSRLTLNLVRRLPSHEWQALGDGPISFGYDTRPYWFRIDIPASTAPRVLQLEYPLLDQVDLYLIDEYGEQSHVRIGDRQAYDQRPMSGDGFAVPINSLSAQTLWMRIETSSSLRAPVLIWDANSFFEAQVERYAAIGLYFGVLLCMIVYNLFGYVVTRESSFFSYSMYVIFTGLLMAALSGFGFQFIWPNWLWLQERAIVFFGGLAFVFASFFITQLFQLHRHSLGWHRGLVALGIVAGFIAIGSTLLPYAVTIRWLLPFAVCACAYVIAIGVAMWVRGVQHAQIFTLAWFLFMVSVMFNSLAYLGLLDGQFIQRYAIMIGSGIEVLLLSWVVTLMYSSERSEKLKLQDEALKNALAAQEAQRILNEELEERVQLRTHELELASASLQKANAELERKSNEDGLTKLYNRRYFDTRLQQEFNRARRQQLPLSLILIDIDNFKSFNDEHGHQVGDEVLIRFGERLQQVATRAADLVCRYGGEEFAVILPDTALADATLVAERFWRAIGEQAFASDAGQLAITASFGVASIQPAMNNASELVTAADQALYKAKHSGRNKIILAPSL